ncbi:MAG: 2-dehydro-3-deoxygalactonokinase [Sphingomonadales bacterium]|jgi:2-dehydro-3-deoxygalactonokinase|nr:2-dehydro-3-deoxygalactonokinase [Sphingomonadales bacterium]
MRWRDGYIAVDWGTTNRRVYLLDGDGRLAEAVEDDLGIMNVPAGGYEAAIAEVRARCGGRPVLLAGMVGSNRGWVEAPYVAAPAGAEELALAVKWIEPGAVGIVPGVSWVGEGRADVMRGEEVQMVGALALGAIGADALICHPGTHAKWIVMAEGRIGAFQTMMTGELFALLGKHSILAPQLEGLVSPDESFRRGAAAGLEGADLLSSLFEIRARHALGHSEGNGASYASGLLIGSDVRAGLRLHRQGAVGLVGRSDLRALYAAALALAGHQFIEVDGADAFLAGMRRLVEML